MKIFGKLLEGFWDRFVFSVHPNSELSLSSIEFDQVDTKRLLDWIVACFRDMFYRLWIYRKVDLSDSKLSEHGFIVYPLL